MTTAVISEVFGPTVQGEGPSTGRRCAFIRLGRCNLDCSWCDTPFTWDWTGKNGTEYSPAEQLAKASIDDIYAAVAAMHVDLVVITGGEPMLQRNALTELCERFRYVGITVEIETNGTQPPWDGLAMANVFFNVSPKLANSGCDPWKRYNAAALDALVGLDATFKFVCVEPACLDEVDVIVAGHGIDRDRVYVMPEGRTPSALARRALADEAIARGYNITGRLHVMLWGDERGH